MISLSRTPVVGGLSRCAALVCLLALAGACNEEVAIHSPRSDIEVRLPKSPNFEPRPDAPRFADGAHSVEALLRDASRKVGREVTVRGLVADTVPCQSAAAAPKPTGKKRGSTEEACHPPAHLYMADEVDAQRYRLLVVGWAANKIRGVRRGQQLTFRGRFQRVSPEGTFIRQAGLLVVDP